MATSPLIFRGGNWLSKGKDDVRSSFLVLIRGLVEISDANLSVVKRSTGYSSMLIKRREFS
jgi:hypothetical protein